jgi:hypothetical protein
MNQDKELLWLLLGLMLENKENPQSNGSLWNKKCLLRLSQIPIRSVINLNRTFYKQTSNIHFTLLICHLIFPLQIRI